MDVEIRFLPRTRVACVPYAGHYMQSGAAWEKLVTFFDRSCFGVTCENPQYYGLSYDNPLQTDLDKRHYDLSVVIQEDFPLPLFMHSKHIGGVEYAVIDMESHIMIFTKLYRHIAEEWSPKSGRTLDHDSPCMARYVVFNKHLPPEHFCTEFFIPLKPVVK